MERTEIQIIEDNYEDDPNLIYIYESHVYEEFAIINKIES